MLFAGIIFVICSNLFTVYPAQVVRTALNMVGDVLTMHRLLDGFEEGRHLHHLLRKSLWVFGGLVVVMAIIRGICLFFTRQTLIVMSRKIEFDQRNEIYTRFQELPMAFYRKNRTGDLMARISEDVGRVRMYVGPGIMYTLNTISLFIVVVIAMFSVNVKLSLIALLPLPILSICVYYIQSIIQKKSELIQEQLSALSVFTQEVFSGIRIVKSYAKEKELGEKFKVETETYKSKTLDLVRIDALFMPVVMTLVGISTILVVWVGSEMVIKNQFTVGNIAEFLIYIGLLQWPIIAVGWVTSLVQRAAASQKRLNELLEVNSDIHFPSESVKVAQAAVDFQRVSFTYEDTGVEALKDISFTLSPGQKIGIIGPAGSGKTTLCHLLVRLIDPQEGHISLDGRPITAYTKMHLRKAIGYAPQDVFLFSETIGNNIAFGKREASEAEVVAAAKTAVVWENIAQFPKGLDTIVGERGVTLSGGQKQRISIARACVDQPLLLVLDDVLSAVDTHTEEEILQNLRQYRRQNRQSAMIMTAHRISCIQDADLILVLENGVITESGNHEALLQQNGYYARIYQKQLLETEESVAP